MRKSDKSGEAAGSSAQLSDMNMPKGVFVVRDKSESGSKKSINQDTFLASSNDAEVVFGSFDTPKTTNIDQPGNVHDDLKKKKRRSRRRKRAGIQGRNAPASTSVNDIEKTTPRKKVSQQKRQGQQYFSSHASTNTYAALDLGTNNCRLLVAIPTRPGNFRVIDAFSRIVRLGEGLGASGRLSDNAMNRAIEALKVCREKLYSRPVHKARLIATEACRSAENGIEFLSRVKNETDLKLEIVDRETEARLAVSGCSSLVDRKAKSVLLFDIGGGSSEIALVGTNRHNKRISDNIRAWTSLPVGVVTMAEKFGGQKVTKQIFEEMVDYAGSLLLKHAGKDLMASAIGSHGSVVNDDFHLIGTSGTITTLAGIHLDLPRYDRRRVDGLWMSAKQVDAVNNQLLSWTYKERSANACIGSDRADLVLAGCAILEAIRKVWPSERLRVADRGLREGILTEMMATDGVWQKRNGRYYNQRKNGRGQRHKS